MNQHLSFHRQTSPSLREPILLHNANNHGVPLRTICSPTGYNKKIIPGQGVTFTFISTDASIMDSEAHSFDVVFTICGLSLLAYSISLAIFRLILHPLAKFPGPRLAALTPWYEFYWNVVKGGKFLWEIERLHQRYGWYARFVLSPSNATRTHHSYQSG